MRQYLISRRRVFYSIVGLAVTVVKLPFEIKPSPKTPIEDQDYFFINGWVLTRKDLAASEGTPDVARL